MKLPNGRLINILSEKWNMIFLELQLMN